MKNIVYLITSNGMDGMDRERISFASYSEPERDQMFSNDKNKNYLSKVDRIVDTELQLKQSKKKIDALDALVLGVNK